MSVTQVLDSNGEFSEPPQTIFLQYWGDGDPEEGVKIHHENVSWCWIGFSIRTSSMFGKTRTLRWSRRWRNC